MQVNDYSVLRGNRVVSIDTSLLRNTYLLLSLTLLFSAITAYFSVITHAGFGLSLAASLVAFGLLFVIGKARSQSLGILGAFAFTGCMGYSLGPMLNYFIHGYSNGAQLIVTALGGTGITFLLSSAYIITSKKDMSYMGKFLMTGLVVCIVGGLANFFFKMPAIQLAISSMMVFISTMLIMFDTSRIIHGGENNYIMATIQLYLDILVLFQNLLYLLAAFSGNNRN